MSHPVHSADLILPLDKFKRDVLSDNDRSIFDAYYKYDITGEDIMYDVVFIKSLVDYRDDFNEIIHFLINIGFVYDDLVNLKIIDHICTEGLLYNFKYLIYLCYVEIELSFNNIEQICIGGHNEMLMWVIDNFYINYINVRERLMGGVGGKDGEEMLVSVARLGHIEVLRFLVQKFNINHECTSWHLMITEAFRHGNMAVAQFLFTIATLSDRAELVKLFVKSLHSNNLEFVKWSAEHLKIIREDITVKILFTSIQSISIFSWLNDKFGLKFHLTPDEMNMLYNSYDISVTYTLDMLYKYKLLNTTTVFLNKLCTRNMDICMWVYRKFPRISNIKNIHKQLNNAIVLESPTCIKYLIQTYDIKLEHILTYVNSDNENVFSITLARGSISTIELLINLPSDSKLVSIKSKSLLRAFNNHRYELNPDAIIFLCRKYTTMFHPNIIKYAELYKQEHAQEEHVYTGQDIALFKCPLCRRGVISIQKIFTSDNCVVCQESEQINMLVTRCGHIICKTCVYKMKH